MNPSIADRLALVLKHNGPSLLDDPDSLRRLLAPAQDPPPPEVRAILAALKSGELTTGVDPVSGDVDMATMPAAQPFEQ
jgi:hypothetical protein